MSFNIAMEASAETVPLSEATLDHTLRNASSSDQGLITSATKQLQYWESKPDYYKYLQSAFIDTSRPRAVRYLAIIQLKNGIDKYWRKTASNAVSKDDKEVIRSRLLASGLDEQDHMLALQNALVLAKVIRLDYPNDWPDAISSVINAVRAAAQPDAPLLRLPRALLILLRITKELATARLIRSRQSLISITPELIGYVGDIYVQKVRSWQEVFASGVGDYATLEREMQVTLLAIKVLRQLLIAGYEFPNRAQEVNTFWGLIREHAASFMTTVSTARASGLTKLVEKHLFQLSKLYVDMATTHPAAFVLLPDSLVLVRSFWDLIRNYGDEYGTKTTFKQASIGLSGDQSDEKSFREKLSLKGFLLIRACIKMVFNPTQTFKYRHPQEKGEKSVATQLVKDTLLTPEFVQDLLEIIISKFFVFRTSDVQQWEEEPEDWEHDMEGEGEGWEFTIRPCAEKLFLDVAIIFRNISVQPLVERFKIAADPRADVSLKESMYTAVGLAAAVVHQDLDFDSYLPAFVQDIQNTDPQFKIIRRRVAILLGQWITIKISEANRDTVYRIFLHLLDANDRMNDQVVLVTAGRHFKNIVDDWDFNADNFLQYASDMLARLMRLIQNVELTETKMALLNTISVMVDRLEHRITPFAPQIVQLISQVWGQSEEEHLLKQVILTILTRLINAMKAESVPYHWQFLPIIRSCVEDDSETRVFLLDDAMDLWGAIICQTPRPASSELLKLAPFLIPIFDLGSENFRKGLEICQSYYLLAPVEMALEEMRQPLIAKLAFLLEGLKPEASGLVSNLIETIVRTLSVVEGPKGVHSVAHDLVASKFLQVQLLSLHSSWTAHCTTGPLAQEAKVDGVIETDYFSVLARLVMGSADVFLEAVSVATLSIDGNSSLDATMKWLLEEWFGHLENIGDPSRRKLMCMALTKLLSAQNHIHIILPHLQQLMSLWTSVVIELREGMDEPNADSLVLKNIDELKPLDQSVPEAPEDERKRQDLFEDPVRRVKVDEWIRDHLTQAIQLCGGYPSFEDQWLVNVDKTVVDDFKKLGII